MQRLFDDSLKDCNLKSYVAFNYGRNNFDSNILLRNIIADYIFYFIFKISNPKNFYEERILCFIVVLYTKEHCILRIDKDFYVNG